MPDNSELVKYYIRHTDERFNEVHKKLDLLLGFRIWLIGAAFGAGFVGSLIFKVATAMAGAH